MWRGVLQVSPGQPSSLGKDPNSRVVLSGPRRVGETGVPGFLSRPGSRT